MKAITILVLVGFILGACASEPRYHTTYTLVPPGSVQGQTCINSCEGNRQICGSIARTEIQSCETDRQEQEASCQAAADKTLRRCLISSPTAGGKSSCRSQRIMACGGNPFGPGCRASSNCKDEFYQCYRSCGGQIKTARTCYQNCDVAKHEPPSAKDTTAVLRDDRVTQARLRLQSGKPMTAAQIKTLLPGKTIVLSHPSGRPMQMSFSANGQATLALGSASDIGKWWVEGENTYCRQFPRAQQGKKTCRYFYHLGNGRYRTALMDGTLFPNSFTLE